MLNRMRQSTAGHEHHRAGEVDRPVRTTMRTTALRGRSDGIWLEDDAAHRLGKRLGQVEKADGARSWLHREFCVTALRTAQAGGAGM
jgi:hypothetical protein